MQLNSTGKEQRYIPCAVLWEDHSKSVALPCKIHLCSLLDLPVKHHHLKLQQRWRDTLGCVGWFGLDWVRLDWNGLDWFGLDWSSKTCIQMPQISTHWILLAFFLPVLKRDPVSRNPHQKCESMYFSCLNTWHHCRTRTGWVSTRWATLSLIYSTDGWMIGDEDATWDTFLKFAETMDKNKIASL